MPQSRFIQVSAGFRHSVGLREDGSVECWGDNRNGQCNAPKGVFKQVVAGNYHSVGIREDGTLISWGGSGWNSQYLSIPPEGVFSQIAASCGDFLGEVGAFLCLEENGQALLWGDNIFLRYEADGVFTQIARGRHFSVGLREDGSVDCWGLSSNGQRDAPSGAFTQISSQDSHSLALREDGTVVGWGTNTHGQCDAPDGKFTQVAVGSGYSLGLREDGTVACWGRMKYDINTDVPRRNFIQVAAGPHHALGLVAD